MCEAVTYFTVHVCLDTKASEKVSARITNKSFCQDVNKMSPKNENDIKTCKAEVNNKYLLMFVHSIATQKPVLSKKKTAYEYAVTKSDLCREQEAFEAGEGVSSNINTYIKCI